MHVKGLIKDYDECIHGQTMNTCTICNGRDARESKERDRQMRTFTAKYDGECAACDGSIHVNDVAHLNGGRLLCESCGNTIHHEAWWMKK